MNLASPSSVPAAGPAPAVIDILLVEDDDAVRAVLIEALERRGYSLRAATDGRQALQQLARQKFQLVITDIFMPQMDGLEMLMKNAASNPHQLVLAISGGGMFGSPDLSLIPARHLGCCRTLAKPFELKEFLAVVAELLAEPSPTRM